MKEMVYKVVVDKYGTIRWYHNNQLHNENGPAIIYADGTQVWYINGKRHNENGPAIIFADGAQSWWINGNLHNETGPAIACADGSKQWWINGKQLSEQEFNARTQKCNHDGDVVTIDGVEYKLNRIG